MQTITIGSNTYNVLQAPTDDGFAVLGFGEGPFSGGGVSGIAEIELTMNDTVATVESPYTRQLQTQTWPGADWWSATITLAPMDRATSWPWEAFLAELRGQTNVFQLGDPRAYSPLGTVTGTPVTQASVVTTANAAFTTQVGVSGWANGDSLIAGDYIQIGYRLHRVVESTGSITSGDAALTIWPSLREAPPDGTTVITTGCLGLFRLASNRRSIHSSPWQLNTISFQAVEAR